MCLLEFLAFPLGRLNCFGLPCRWHDAGTYDVNTRTGGANGSIRYEEEYTHGSNAGLKIAIDLLGMYYIYPKTNLVVDGCVKILIFLYECSLS